MTRLRVSYIGTFRPSAKPFWLTLRYGAWTVEPRVSEDDVQGSYHGDPSALQKYTDQHIARVKACRRQRRHR